MRNYKEHLINANASVRDALVKLDLLAEDAIIFVINDDQELVGSITDGDIRRGLIMGVTTESSLTDFAEINPKFIYKRDYKIDEIISLRKGKFKILPVLDADNKVCNVINFRLVKSYLPVDAIVMAGGRGKRLRPHTDDTPKPLLKVGNKAIIDHNVDRLRKFGIDDFWISVRYLGEQLENHFKDGTNRGVKINYVWENEPLGTIGAVSKIESFENDYVLLTNSDILTTMDYEDFFVNFINKNADMMIAAIPYQVDIPYAVLETKNELVTSCKEKPTYTYYSNAGIYLIKKEILELIPKNTFYDATDLIDEVIRTGKRIMAYPIREYWLDIGKPEDFSKAQEDIKHLNL